MKYLFILLVIFLVLVFAGCSEKEFSKGLNNVWTSGAGNAAGAPMFTAETEKDKSESEK